MLWTKPYQPASNQRLAPKLYELESTIVFITIRSYRNQTPFIKCAINRVVYTVLLVKQGRINCRVFTICLMPDPSIF